MTKTLKRFGLGFGVAVLALGVAAAVVHASTQNTAGGAGPFMGRHAPFARLAGLAGPLGRMRLVAARLGLTDAQNQQVQTIAQSHRDEWKALADRAVAAHKALNDAVTADVTDEAAIRQRSAEAAAVQADIAVARAHARAEMFQVLTPDQQAQAKTMRKRMAERFERFRKSW
jgi:Spy/CpxP family protein refolding chaperone